MKLSFLIVIVVLFSSSLFAIERTEWGLLPLKISDILKEGYELKEVTVDPTSESGLYRILYHFISYKNKVIVICSVDIEYSKSVYTPMPKGTICFINP